MLERDMIISSVRKTQFLHEKKKHTAPLFRLVTSQVTSDV